MRRRPETALGLMAALTLAACAPVGPNYRVPGKALVNAPLAQSAFASASSATTAAEPPDAWWRLFDDPTLAHLVSRALAANADLRIAEANLKRSGALLALARTRQEVGGAVDVETSYVQQSAEAALQHVKPPEKQIYNGGVGVSYDLDLFGGIRRGIEAGQADVEAVAAARDLVRTNVAAETTRAYAQVCSYGRELAATRRVLAVQTAELQLVQAIVAHGRAAPFEAERQQSLVATIQAGVAPLQAARLNAAYRLAVLMGDPPAAYDHDWLTCESSLSPSGPLPVGDGKTLLARRPDVRAAERRLAGATARIGVATAELYPDVKLGASIGSTGATRDLLSPLTNRFGIGPSIVWNLNQNVARARIAQANADSEATLASFDGTVLRALRETESALETYNSDLDRLGHLQTTQAHAADVAAQMRKLRRGGRADVASVLSAEFTLAIADQSVAGGETRVEQDLIGVFLALGGGWRPPSVLKAPLEPARPQGASAPPPPH